MSPFFIVFTEMATTKRCSICKKELGPMHCTGCDEYFCTKHFRIHREEIVTQMDKIVEERNHLQDQINNVPQNDNQQSPLLKQIDQWRDVTIEKVRQVAAQARHQAIQLLNSKSTKINTEFKSFSQDLAHLRETENYVEHDLTRLNEMISQFKQDLRQSNEPAMIKLRTEQSDGINWDCLIYVEEKQSVNSSRQPQRQAASKLISFYIF